MVIPVSEFMNLEFAHLFDFVDYFTNVDPSGKSTDRHPSSARDRQPSSA